MLRFGIVEYINAFPFHLPFKLGALQNEAIFTFDVPSKLNQMLNAQELDIALTSSTAYFDEGYELVPGYGIAAQREILSVNLYTRVPLDGARIGLTSDSATSARLLKILCHHFWKVKPQFEPLASEEEQDAFLLIGDAALRKMTIPGYKTIDLAAAWYEATGLPFVFAALMAREGIEWNRALFEQPLGWSEANREYIVEAAHTRSGLPKALINRYYDICCYRLGEREREGLEHFKRLSYALPKISA